MDTFSGFSCSWPFNRTVMPRRDLKTLYPKEGGNSAEYLERHKVSNVSSFEVKRVLNGRTFTLLLSL